MRTRTSVTDPIRVDWLPGTPAGGGAVGMTFAPGKCGMSTHGFRWERDLDADLEQLAKVERTDLLVSLIEDHELGLYGIPHLFARVAAHGIELHRLPIRDLHIPADKLVRATLDLIQTRVAEGKRVVVHCNSIGGLGRTGTIAGCYLVSTGMPAPDALATLRRLRGGKDDRCPEILDQRKFVRDWSDAPGVRGTYPFGAPLREVVQEDRTPKRVFVLGAYASAVHARWVDPGGRTLVRALAVASEPFVFWDGANAAEVVARIALGADAGRLEAAEPAFNGPSGRSLEQDYLRPLGVPRADGWFCDLVPHTCLNDAQRLAIQREYEPRAQALGLPAVDLPPVPKAFADDARRLEINAEIEQAKPDLIVLLGDHPIRHWLRFHDARWHSLADFGDKAESYGRRHRLSMNGRQYEVLPLAHPRQVAGLGDHSPRWRELHARWKDAQPASTRSE
jgi:protein-tyrosine phosphatase/uracil-DNA glycosylase